MLIDDGSWTTGPLGIGLNSHFAGATKVTVENNGSMSAGPIDLGVQGLLDDASTVDSGNFSLDPGGVLAFDIAALGKLNVHGFASFDGTIDIDFIDGFAPSPGESFDLINASGGADFADAIINVNGLESGLSFTFSDGTLTVTAASEPTSIALAAAGLGVIGLAVLRQRLRRGSA